MMTGKHEWSRMHGMMQLAVSSNNHLLLVWINFNWQASHIQDFMLFFINAALLESTTGSITSRAKHTLVLNKWDAHLSLGNQSIIIPGKLPCVTIS